MKCFSVLLFCFAATAACAQTGGDSTGWISAHAATVTAARASQPGWASPLVSESLRLNQGIRYDVQRQSIPTGHRMWLLGAPVAVTTIPFAKVELDFVPPARVWNNNAAVKDGANDLAFAAKYRFLSANEKQGNYVGSAWLIGTVPTGSYTNGMGNATLTPGFGFGKGYGHFAAQSTLAATLPLGNQAAVITGRPVMWNTLVQYRFAHYIVPQLEDDWTVYKDGAIDGLVQNFVTPGLWLGGIPLHSRSSHSPRAFAVGAAMQVATSQRATYNHGLVLTGRFLF